MTVLLVRLSLIFIIAAGLQSCGKCTQYVSGHVYACTCAYQRCQGVEASWSTKMGCHDSAGEAAAAAQSACGSSCSPAAT